MDTPLLTRRCTGGNATDYALLKFCHPLRDIYEHRGSFPLVAVLPFNSTTKWAVSLVRDTDSGRGGYDLYMKGAPERVIGLCTSILINGEKQRLSSKWIKKFTQAYEELGGAGERVIGFAKRHLDKSKYPDDFAFDVDEVNFPVERLTFIGLISLIDPPREAVPSAVKACLVLSLTMLNSLQNASLPLLYCRSVPSFFLLPPTRKPDRFSLQTAKIKVVMVTGDHPLTAKAIAHQVGILRDETREVLPPSLISHLIHPLAGLLTLL